MFKLDEAVLNEQFGRGLDTMPSSVVSRSADFPVIGFLALLRLPRLPLMQLLGHNQEEIGLKVIFTDKLLRQDDEDVIGLILRSIINNMLTGIMKKHFSTGRPLTVGPLLFEYQAGITLVGDEYVDGVEVVVLTSIEWNTLG